MLLRLLLSLSLVFLFIKASLASTEAVIQTSTGLHHIEAEIRFLYRHKRTFKTNFGSQSTYTATNGLTCLVCPPGFYRKSDCTTNSTIAVCEPCKDRHYNNQYNIATSCAQCSAYCIDKNAVPETTCNATADMTCRCKDGYFNHSKGSGEWICLQHSPCQPGTELRNTGTPEHNTVCNMCENGTFSPNMSLTAKCLPCSTCDGDRKIHKACNEKTDVICSSHDTTPIVNIVVAVVITFIAIAVIVIAVVCLHRKGKLSIYKTSGKTDGDDKPYVGIDLNENTINERKELCNPQDEFEIEICSIPQKSHNQTDDPIQNGVTWSQLFSEVSANIRLADSIWIDFLRKLFSKVYPNVEEIDNKIDENVINHKHDGVKEQIYRCLVAWKKKAADDACLEDILQALDKCRMQEFSGQLRLKYASLYRRTDIAEADDYLREQD
ncbi:tumor necrosis factor receptor superfamily member 11B-like [Mytilus trossulus]|uniref:tumor necrosis factor receptor superfamily member 11B-like n=1 Tax=Mytilus trossulus TaxID=6551 RepID=UPI003004C890